MAEWMTQHLGFLVSGGVVGATEAPVLLLATVVVIASTLAQIGVLKAMRKPVDKDAVGGAGEGRGGAGQADLVVPQRNLHQMEAHHCLLADGRRPPGW